MNEQVSMFGQRFCLNCGIQIPSNRSANARYCSQKCEREHKGLIGKRTRDKRIGHVSIWNNTATANLLLNGYEHKCPLCGYCLDGCVNLHHIVEVANGGKNELENIIPICANCHNKIHKNLISQEEIRAVQLSPTELTERAKLHRGVVSRCVLNKMRLAYEKPEEPRLIIQEMQEEPKAQKRKPKRKTILNVAHKKEQHKPIENLLADTICILENGRNISYEEMFAVLGHRFDDAMRILENGLLADQEQMKELFEIETNSYKREYIRKKTWDILKERSRR